MGCSLDSKIIDKSIEFHGHSCPGLAIGLRVSELAMQRLGIDKSSSPVCVTETDMCAVDAIQFLTGCTFGKGNLIHKDFGKSVFTFFDRDRKKGFRAVLKDDIASGNDPDNETGRLMQRMADGTASDEDRARAAKMRSQRIDEIMAAELEDLFHVKDVDTPPVKPARILDSILCECCGEKTMESRIRRFGGKYLCIPCFMQTEQKI